ncbi:MAG TPA: hypothetical protein VE267_18985, partial [Bradyrhizobium sp.]|nr:hypothetical protein [Bradyrhizobium sp.]
FVALGAERNSAMRRADLADLTAFVAATLPSARISAKDRVPHPSEPFRTRSAQGDEEAGSAGMPSACSSD